MALRWPWSNKTQEPETIASGAVRRRILFSGRVQAVGFRYTATQYARDRKLTGWIRNMDDGSVLCEVQGQPEDIEGFLADIAAASANERTFLSAHVASVEALEPKPERGFHIHSI